LNQLHIQDISVAKSRGMGIIPVTLILSYYLYALCHC